MLVHINFVHYIYGHLPSSNILDVHVDQVTPLPPFLINLKMLGKEVLIVRCLLTICHYIYLVKL